MAVTAPALRRLRTGDYEQERIQDAVEDALRRLALKVPTGRHPITVKLRVPNASPTTLRTYLSTGGRQERLVEAALSAKTAPTSAAGTVKLRLYKAFGTEKTELTASAADLELLVVDKRNRIVLVDADTARVSGPEQVLYAEVTSDNADVNEGEDVYITCWFEEAD